MTDLNLLTAQGMDLDIVLDSLGSRPLEDCKAAFTYVCPTWGTNHNRGILARLVGAQVTPAEFTRRFIDRNVPKERLNDPDFLESMEISSLATECIRRSMTDKELFAFCFPQSTNPDQTPNQVRYGFVTAQSAALEDAIREPANLILERLQNLDHHAAILVFPKFTDDTIDSGTGMLLSNAPFEEILAVIHALTVVRATSPGVGSS